MGILLQQSGTGKNTSQILGNDLKGVSICVIYSTVIVLDTFHMSIYIRLGLY